MSASLQAAYRQIEDDDISVGVHACVNQRHKFRARAGQKPRRERPPSDRSPFLPHKCDLALYTVEVTYRRGAAGLVTVCQIRPWNSRLAMPFAANISRESRRVSDT